MSLTISAAFSLIVSALERRFPPSAGYGTLFPRGKHGGSPGTGLIKAFSKYYPDQLFALAPQLLNWAKFPAAFLKDRSAVSSPYYPRPGIIIPHPNETSSLALHLMQMR